MTPTHPQCDTWIEEWLSAVVHGLGVLLALAGVTVMLSLAAMYGATLHLICLGVFGLAAIAVYAASTLLHLTRTHLATQRPGDATAPQAHARWHRLERLLLECDHTAIYLLIAGTYTPLVLLALGGAWGWTLFAAAWLLALTGMSLRLILQLRHPLLSLSFYLATGWVGLVAIGPVLEALSITGLALVLAGGVAYTMGVVFFLWHRLAFNHAIWHAFVLVGTSCHYLAVWHETMPLPST